MNTVLLIGSLDRDPELANRKGLAMTRFQIKTIHRYEDRTGTEHEQIDLHRCIAFGALAITVSGLTRGERVGIEGRISSKPLTRNGERRWRTEIVVERVEFLTPRALKGRAVGAIVSA